MRSFKQEPQHALHIVGVTRARDDDMRHFVLTQTIGRRVADGAVVGDSLEPNDFFRKADRNFMSLFPNNTERLVAAWPRHQVGKNARQNHPEIIGDAAIALRAERTVFEMFLFVRKDFLLFAEEFCPRKQSAERKQDRDHNRGDPKNAFLFRRKTH